MQSSFLLQPHRSLPLCSTPSSHFLGTCLAQVFCIFKGSWPKCYSTHLKLASGPHWANQTLLKFQLQFLLGSKTHKTQGPIVSNIQTLMRLQCTHKVGTNIPYLKEAFEIVLPPKGYGCMPNWHTYIWVRKLNSSEPLVGLPSLSYAYDCAVYSSDWHFQRFSPRVSKFLG